MTYGAFFKKNLQIHKIHCNFASSLSVIRHCMKHLLLRSTAACLFTLFSMQPLYATKDHISVSLSAEETKLYELIMSYRASYNLPSIPLSPALTYVAHTHVRDLAAYHPTGECNLHSWSEHGEWTPCCYTSDHAQAQLMWNKPRELTTYTGAGYEIAFYNSAGATAASALAGWKPSHGHNTVVINQEQWSSKTWKAIGIGIYRNYAVVWFGEELDPSTDDKVSNSESQIIVPTRLPYPTTAATTPTQATVSTPEVITPQQSITAPRQLPTSITSTSTTYRSQTTTSTKQPHDTQQVFKENSKWRDITIPTNRYPQPFYNYSGKSFLSVIGLGYTYSFINRSHLVNASVLDFRTGLFGMSPICAEMVVSPYRLSVAYRPTINLYIPLGKNTAIVPYAGTVVDATGLGKYIVKDFSYSMNDDFYVGAVAGIGFHLSVVRWLPMQIRAEYRHPIINTQSPFNQKSLYLSVQIYIGKYFQNK